MGYREDDDIEEDDNMIILNIDDFVKNIYLFSIRNLDVSMLPVVNNEKNPNKRDDIKEEIMTTMDLDSLNPQETEDMVKLLPMSYAKDLLLEKMLKNEDNDFYVSVVDLMEIISQVSRKMLYCLFDKLHKDGLVDLLWDDKKSEFFYSLKKTAVENKIDTSKEVTKKKLPTKRKKK